MWRVTNKFKLISMQCVFILKIRKSSEARELIKSIRESQTMTRWDGKKECLRINQDVRCAVVVVVGEDVTLKNS